MNPTKRQPSYRHLFGPRVTGIRNAFNRGGLVDRLKVYFFGGLTLLFWAGLLIAGILLIGRLTAEEPIGTILVHKFLGFLFMMFFAVLVFSNVVTSLTNLFLAEDLYLVITAPVKTDRVFLSRSLAAGLQSGWMVMLFALPIWLAAGIVMASPWWYYPWMVAVMAVFLLLPSAIGSLVTTLLVRAFPARKTQDVLIIMSIGLVVVFYFLVRFLRPEQLFNPDLFHGFAEYFATLQAPNSPLIPSVWATEALWGGLTGKLTGDTWLLAAFGLFSGLAAMAVSAWAADRWYLDAYSKAQEGRKARLTTSAASNRFFDALAGFSRPLRRMIIVKDLKTFFRETTQWTQLLLLLALCVVYLFNFKVLPLDRFGLSFYHRSLITFVNIVLAGFVLSAVSVRFVLPAISTEGRGFWLLRAAPVNMRDVVLAKFTMMVVPIVVIGQALVVISNVFLGTHSFLMVYTSAMMFFISVATTAMAIGIGAIMPSFNERNIARMATGASSIVYMVAAMAFIMFMVILGFFPGKAALFAIISERPLTGNEWLGIGAAAAVALVVFAAAVAVPLRLGIHALERREN
jgi:ABC-2 type transport system permease protein